MSKIKVLVLPSDRTGVGKFRSVEPHIFLQNKFSEDQAVICEDIEESYINELLDQERLHQKVLILSVIAGILVGILIGMII